MFAVTMNGLGLPPFSDGIALTCDMFVIGERVFIVAFDYDDNTQRGLTAHLRRADGSEHVSRTEKHR